MSEEFKSTQYLNKLSEILATNESVKQDSLKSLNSVVSFEVSNKKSKSKQYWILDSKDSGELKQLDGPADESKSEIKIRISDADLRKLIIGKASAQKLFMTGKLKIKGNVMKAANIEKLLKFVGPQKSKL